MDQHELWLNVQAIKRRVRDAIGADLSHEFRSSNTYQGYTGLCGEAQMAYADGTLDEELVKLLGNYAGRVIELYRQHNP
jgi:hypothetical protein